MALGSAEIALVLVLTALFVIAPIWTLADAASRPVQAFDAIGQSRTTWMVLAVAGIVVCQIGGAVWGLYYLLRVRPRLARTTTGTGA